MLKLAAKNDGHYHYVYVFENIEQDQEPVAQSSKNKGHKHEIVFDADIRDFVILEAEGHTHALTDVERKEISLIKKQKDEDKVSELHDLYQFSYSNDKENIDNAEESDDFYNGIQWDEGAKRKLESVSRATLTINEAASKIDMLIGYQRQNRSDFKFYPVEEGDSKVAEVLDFVVKNINDNSEYQYEETAVATDQFIVGKGIFNVYVDYTKNLEGEIVIENMPWGDIVFGPYTKFDLSDCEYLFKKKMFSKAKLEQMFPDKAKDLTEDFNYFSEADGGDKTVQRVFGKQYVISKGEAISMEFGGGTDNTTEVMVDIKKKSYKVFEAWRKVYRIAKVMSVLNDEFADDISDLPSADSIGTIDGVEINDVETHNMRVTKYAGGVILSDEISDVPYNDFDITVAHAKFRNGKWYGKMEEVKDVQREVNKRTSQIVDIMNKCAAYGWIYGNNTFRNNVDEQNFLDQAGTPGFAVKCDDTQQKPELVQGIKFPGEIVQLEQMATEKMHRIMNIPMNMMGLQGNSRDLSGRAIIEQRRQGLVANEYLFDNLNLAKKLLAKKIIALIQEVYTPERILRLISNVNTEGMKKPEVLQMEREELIAMLENSDLTKYDIVVSQSPFSDTIRQANHQLLTETMAQGAPVPFEYWVQQSDLPNKDDLLNLFQQQRQAEQQAVQQAQQTEIAKTQIAAQSKLQGNNSNAAPTGGPQ